jgi:hypothetical protein
MAQAISRQPPESRARAPVSPCGICDGLGQVCLPSSSVSPVSIIVSWLSMVIITSGMNNRPFGGSRSETQSHPIDMNNMVINQKYKRCFNSFVGN